MRLGWTLVLAALAASFALFTVACAEDAKTISSPNEGTSDTSGRFYEAFQTVDMAEPTGPFSFHDQEVERVDNDPDDSHVDVRGFIVLIRDEGAPSVKVVKETLATCEVIADRRI